MTRTFDDISVDNKFPIRSATVANVSLTMPNPLRRLLQVQRSWVSRTFDNISIKVYSPIRAAILAKHSLELSLFAEMPAGRSNRGFSMVFQLRYTLLLNANARKRIANVALSAEKHTTNTKGLGNKDVRWHLHYGLISNPPSDARKRMQILALSAESTSHKEAVE